MWNVNGNGCYVVCFWSAGIIYNCLIQSGIGIISLLLPTVVFVCYLINESTLCNSKMIMSVGTFSYSLYLSHEFVVKGFSRLLFSLDEITMKNFLLSLICIVIALIVGFIVNQFLKNQQPNF